MQYASASIEELTGFVPDEVVGRNILGFVDSDQLDSAVAGLGEILGSERPDPGIPVVFAVTRKDGGVTWVEVAVMAIDDLVVLRLQSWEAERHRAAFLRALLADAPLAGVLEPLCRSIGASLEALGVAVHHGFDGSTFEGVVGSWVGAGSLPLDAAPWTEAVWRSDLLEAPASALGAATTWMVPVAGKAVLTVWQALPDPPLLGHRNAMVEAAAWVQLALVRAVEHERLLALARTDSLTGAWNRASFRDRLTAALLAGEPGLAVAYCDLDGFKEVNDRYGHRVGDEVLVNVAARLGRGLRSGDDLARLGGDEFTVLCRDVGDAAAAAEVGRRLLAAFEQPFTVPGGTVPLGMSVGVARAAPGSTADALVAAADAALYEAKARGGSTCVVSG